ncbi:hypothetical protein Tco_1291489 [Tanacetum coccineum]
MAHAVVATAGSAAATTVASCGRSATHGRSTAAAAAGKAAAVVVVPAVVTQMVARSDEDGGEDGVKILAGKDGGSPEKSAGEDGGSPEKFFRRRRLLTGYGGCRKLKERGRGFLSGVCINSCYNEKIS